jgi:hypothetical protein
VDYHSGPPTRGSALACGPVPGGGGDFRRQKSGGSQGKGTVGPLLGEGLRSGRRAEGLAGLPWI